MNSDLTIAWKGLEWDSIECLQRNTDHSAISSHINGVIDSVPFSIQYKMQLDAARRVTELQIHDLIQATNNLALHKDDKGHWFLNDTAQHGLKGCIDVDITLTPFTNTLPLRRLQLAAGIPTEIEVVYITLPQFRVEKVKQYYTKISDSTYLFETADKSFHAEIFVDKEGYVISYPGLFERIYP